MLLMVLPLQRLSSLLPGTRLLAGLGDEHVLNLIISIVDQKHRTAVEAIPFEAIDDFGQRVDLGEQDWDLMDQKALAVVQERCQNRSELVRLDLPPVVLVLSHVRSGRVVPNLMRKTPRMRSGGGNQQLGV
jgi:hypothetical protein